MSKGPYGIDIAVIANGLSSIQLNLSYHIDGLLELGQMLKMTSLDRVFFIV